MKITLQILTLTGILGCQQPPYKKEFYKIYHEKYDSENNCCMHKSIKYLQILKKMELMLSIFVEKQLKKKRIMHGWNFGIRKKIVGIWQIPLGVNMEKQIGIKEQKK